MNYMKGIIPIVTIRGTCLTRPLTVQIMQLWI